MTSVFRYLWHLCVHIILWDEFYATTYMEHNAKVDPGKVLAIWIDGKEIEQFIGVPMDIFVIREANVVPYLQDAYFGEQLPVLPPEVHVVKLSWQAPDDIYRYSFSDLRSLDPQIMYDPLLSIPQAGYVPKEPTDFQVAIPCTGLVTGVASMYIVLHIQNKRGNPVPGSPLKLHLKKRCIALDGKGTCTHGCQNGGHCNKYGRCECKPGYYGNECELAVCFPGCENEGRCVSPGICKCLKGYDGNRCQKAICQKPCLNGGDCAHPDLCDCPNGYYGNHCQFKSGECKPNCVNGGTCTSDNKCICSQGYTGQHCQKPFCKRSCGVHGKCISADKCECYKGWRGKHCHKAIIHANKFDNLKDEDGLQSDSPRVKSRRKRRKNSRTIRYGRWSQVRRRMSHRDKETGYC